MIKIYNKNGVILNTQDKYCNENIEVAIDTTDLTPENILKGKRILGIDGTAETGSGGGITPSGEITLTTEGTFDVTQYASAKVQVEKEEQTITPTKDTINVYPSDGKFLNKVIVNPIPSNYISPTGETSATANGRYDCTEYAWFNVNVPETIPEGYIKPEGSVEITSNGNHDVTNYATATVNVPIPDGYIVPTGTISVTKNGTVNVTSYASAEINVPIPDGYILPSGNFEITANGDYDITDKKTVSVNVPTGGGDSLWAERMNGRLKDKNLNYLFAYDSAGMLDATPYLAGYDTSSVQHTEYMFFRCSRLQTVPLFNTSGVISMSHMFEFSTIPTIPLLNTSNVTNMDYMFAYTQITAIPQLDTHNVTNMTNMFAGCVNLTSIPQLDTINVTSMDTMFAYSNNLTSLPQLNTSNVTNMDNMFTGCNKLTSLPQLDTSNVTDMRGTFQSCYVLETVDITSMDKLNYASSSYYLFDSCYSLKKIIIRNMTVTPKIHSTSFNGCYHFLGTVDATYNPDGLADGYLYVPDDKVETLKSATNWSTIATQIKPLSELEG